MIGASQIAQALGTPSPTPEQVAIIEAPLESMLVVAGAGSGKTETMASRVLWLVVNDHLQPDEVLGLTFTRKASIELAGRLVEKLRALRASGLWAAPPTSAQAALLAPTVSTYHAYAGRIVAEHGLRFGVEPHSTMLSEAACWQIAYEVVHAHEGDMTAMDLAENTVVQAVLDLSGELSEHLVTPDRVQQWLLDQADYAASLPGKDGKPATKPGAALAATLRKKALIVPLVQAYRAAKRSRSALDFGDQMAIAAQLARDVPAVAASERSRFRAVLLDEFQDTSEAQMVLLSCLYAPLDSGSSIAASGEGADPVPVMAVGDPHQSIYAWRGASATTLNTFPGRFTIVASDGSRAPAPVRSLSTSWRNSHAVLQVANTVARPLRLGSPVTVKEVCAAPKAPAGSVQLLRSLTHRDEAAEVASWVADRWFDDAGVWAGRSAAVLCRNRAQFDVIVSALREHHLPVEVVGLGGLLNAPELVDLVALLWAVQDPGRGDQVIRLLSGPVCRLGAADLDALWSWARHLVADYPEERASLGEALDHPPALGWVSSRGATLSACGSQRVRRLSAVIGELRGAVGMPITDLLIEAERSIGLDIEVAADPDVPDGWARAHLDALIEVGSAFEGSADRPTLGGFLSWLEAARAHERALEDVEIPELAEISVRTGAVQVLTVHAAKGLEWDVVAIPGLAEGIFPVLPGQPKLLNGEWKHKANAAKGWLSGIGALPYPLRGDVEGLPLLDLSAVRSTHDLVAAQTEFFEDGVSHRVAEERRLAYVAFTRAKKEMLLSAPVWSTGKKPRVTSRFLTETLCDCTCACDIGSHSDSDIGSHSHSDIDQPGDIHQSGDIDQSGDIAMIDWTPMPGEEDEQNPLASQEDRAEWPVVPGARRARMIDVVRTVLDTRETRRVQAPRDSALADPMSAMVKVLLAEREQFLALLEAPQGSATSAVPAQLSTTAVLDVIADREGFLRRLRRPMPTPPSPQAELGTAFHAWVEHHYAQPTLLNFEVEEPGDLAARASSVTLADLQVQFLASEWADRQPVGLEIAVTTTLAGRTVKGRIDAVFPRHDGGFTVVDWKTGRPPSSPGERARRDVQLAVYRLAYARLVSRKEADIDTAFFYAVTGETVRPDPLSAQQVEELLRVSLDRVTPTGQPEKRQGVVR